MSSIGWIFLVVLILFVVVEVIQLVRQVVSHRKKRKEINNKEEIDVECNSDRNS